MNYDKLPTWRRPPYLPMDCSIGNPAILMRRALRYVRSRSMAVQAGAHVGFWPAWLADENFKRVMAFEPVLLNYQAARDSQRSPVVEIINAGLSDRNGEFLIGPMDPTKAKRFSGSFAVNDHGEKAVCLALDTMPPERVFGVTLLMLDIEGHELPALRGARKTIKRDKPVITVEENAKSLRHRARGEVQVFLRGLGYELVDRVGDDLIFACE